MFFSLIEANLLILTASLATLGPLIRWFQQTGFVSTTNTASARASSKVGTWRVKSPSHHISHLRADGTWSGSSDGLPLVDGVTWVDSRAQRLDLDERPLKPPPVRRSGR